MRYMYVDLNAGPIVQLIRTFTYSYNTFRERHQRRSTKLAAGIFVSKQHDRLLREFPKTSWPHVALESAHVLERESHRYANHLRHEPEVHV